MKFKLWLSGLMEISNAKKKLLYDCGITAEKLFFMSQNELKDIRFFTDEDRKLVKKSAESFDIEYFSIDNMNKNVHMCNIRLYENKYSIGDTYKVDMYSQITRNASKLILVDTPNTANKMRFISPIK